MPDDDLTRAQLLFRLHASGHTLRRITERLGIEPRRAGGATYYTLEQVAAIEAEHLKTSVEPCARPRE